MNIAEGRSESLNDKKRKIPKSRSEDLDSELEEASRAHNKIGYACFVASIVAFIAVSIYYCVKAFPAIERHFRENKLVETVPTKYLTITAVVGLVFSLFMAIGFFALMYYAPMTGIYLSFFLAIASCIYVFIIANRMYHGKQIYYVYFILGLYILLIIIKYFIVRKYLPLNAFYFKTASKILIANKAIIPLVLILSLIITLVLLTTGVAAYGVYQTDYKKGLKYLIIFAIAFIGLWISLTLKNICHTIISLVATKWFYLPSGLKKNTVFSALKQILIYSTGSIAIISLIALVIKTICEIIRIVLSDNQYLYFIADCILGIIEEILNMFCDYVFVHIALHACSAKKAMKKTKKMFKHSFAPVFHYFITRFIIYNFALTVALTAFFIIQQFLSNYIYAAIICWFVFVISLNLFLDIAMISYSIVLTLSLCYHNNKDRLEETQPIVVKKYKERLADLNTL